MAHTLVLQRGKYDLKSYIMILVFKVILCGIYKVVQDLVSKEYVPSVVVRVTKAVSKPYTIPIINPPNAMVKKDRRPKNI